MAISLRSMSGISNEIVLQSGSIGAHETGITRRRSPRGGEVDDVAGDKPANRRCRHERADDLQRAALQCAATRKGNAAAGHTCRASLIFAR
jgi:hypothetical protein